MSSALNTFTSSDRINQFRQIADKICEIAAKHSLNLASYHSAELPLYNALPAQKQTEVLAQLKVFLRTMEATVVSGDQLDRTDRALWHALVTLGLRPPSNLFSRLRASDVIEMYDLQGIQIWRNFNFLRVCSYTLEEMYSVDWPSRYSRDPEKTAECLGKVGEFLGGKGSDVHEVDISDHILEETKSNERYVLQVRHNLVCRLKDADGNLSAWLAISDAKLLGKSLAKWKTRPELHVMQPQPQLDL